MNPIECTECHTILWKQDIPSHQTGSTGEPGVTFSLDPFGKEETARCPKCHIPLKLHAVTWQETENYIEVGTVQVTADLWGFKFGEQEKSNYYRDEKRIWFDKEETLGILPFLQKWQPVIECARLPQCPNHEGDLDIIVTLYPDHLGCATLWRCYECGKEYRSGDFGEDLTETGNTSNTSSQPITQASFPPTVAPAEADDWDPFLDSDELP